MSSFAKMASMAAHANAFLAGLIPAPRWQDFDAFRYVREVAFTVGWDQGDAGSTYEDWLKNLQQWGTTRARLFVEPYGGEFKTIQLLGFANAQRWAIETDAPATRLIWYLRDTVLDRDDPEQKIWRSQFGGFSLAEETPSLRPSLSDAEAALRAALQEAEEFAEEQKLDTFRGQFAAAAAVLDAPDSEVGAAFGVFPAKGYSLPARRLQKSAMTAYAFGGMGSWNDVATSEGSAARYQAVSEALYVAVMGAMAAAVDAFSPSDE